MTYRPLAVLLHWLLALMMISLFAVGLWMSDLPLSPLKLKIYSYHKWAGITVFGLVALRLSYRLFNPPPAPPHMPAWQLLVSKITHGVLYGLMFLIPLSGWLYSSAAGYTTVYFGVWALPDLVEKSESLKEILHETHEILNFTMIALVGLHAAAALKHQFIDKDGLLRRMWF
jgi:cytochrome b561